MAKKNSFLKQIVWGGVSQKKVLIVGGIFYVEKKLSFELFFTFGRKECLLWKEKRKVIFEKIKVILEEFSPKIKNY